MKSAWVTLLLLTISAPCARAQDRAVFGTYLDSLGRLAIVTDVVEGTAARRVARAGDILLTLDGKTVGDASAWIDALSSRKAGTRVVIEALRGAKVVTWRVTLGTLPDSVEEAPRQMDPASQARFEFLRGLSEDPRPRARVLRRAMEALRQGAFQRATPLLAVNRWLVAAEIGALETGETASLRRVLGEADALLGVARLGVRLPDNPADPAAAARTRARAGRLIAQLGAPRWRDRDAASRELVAIGPLALPLLAACQDDERPEVRWRSRRAVVAINERTSSGPFPWRLVVLSLGAPDARGVRRLVVLAGPPPRAGATWDAIATGPPEQRGKRVRVRVIAGDRARADGGPTAVELACFVPAGD